MYSALIAQLGERKTEDLKVTGSIPVWGIAFLYRIVACYIYIYINDESCVLRYII